MTARTLSSVTWVAEHRPETHRTLNNDHTVTVEELPGQIYLYAVIDGGRVLMDMLSASKVFEAIATANANAEAQQTQASPPPAEQPPQPPQQAEQPAA